MNINVKDLYEKIQKGLTVKEFRKMYIKLTVKERNNLINQFISPYERDEIRKNLNCGNTEFDRFCINNIEYRIVITKLFNEVKIYE